MKPSTILALLLTMFALWFMVFQFNGLRIAVRNAAQRYSAQH